MTKVVPSAALIFCLAAAVSAQVSNQRDANGNLIRPSAPLNNTQPMINSTANNPPRGAQNMAPTADQNMAPTADDVSRMLGNRR
jgi:hypothetical protein